jgi:N6-L-threonylcarbamoyladenine synthase
LLAGGVASNSLLRQRLVESSPLPVLIPPLPLCTDNAAMIAACGYYRFQAGKIDGLDLDVVPGLKLA